MNTVAIVSIRRRNPSYSELLYIIDEQKKLINFLKAKNANLEARIARTKRMARRIGR